MDVLDNSVNYMQMKQKKCDFHEYNESHSGTERRA